MKKTIGNWNKEKLLNFKEGRRNVIYALEKIVVWKECFLDAARIILMLAEAENETWSNNASGLFVSLFSSAIYKAAPTELPPKERFKIILEAFDSGSVEKINLALEACNRALYYGNTVIRGRKEYQGISKEAKLWKPETYKEIIEVYIYYWEYLVKSLESNVLEDKKDRIVEILLDNGSNLLNIKPIEDMIIETYELLSKKEYVDNGIMLKKIYKLLRYREKNLSKKNLNKLNFIKSSIEGNDFYSKLKRYVCLNLLEDKFDKDGNRTNDLDMQIENLAEQSYKSFNLLENELDWFLKLNAPNGYLFGYKFGILDKEFNYIEKLTSYQLAINQMKDLFFLGGYFKVIFEKDRIYWENIIKSYLIDDVMRKIVPELVWRSGMTDEIVCEILEYAKNGKFDFDDLKIFNYSNKLLYVSEDVIENWLNLLLCFDDMGAYFSSLELSSSYFSKADKKLSEKLGRKLLFNEKLLSPRDMKYNMNYDFYWNKIAKILIDLYPHMNDEISDFILKNFGLENTVFDSIRNGFTEVLEIIAKEFPENTWENVKKYIEFDTNTRAFYITNWLRGENNFYREEYDFEKKSWSLLKCISIDLIWDWVDIDVDKRAWYLASFIPYELFFEKDELCLARELLVKYGDREEVKSNLKANFSTEGWSGHQSVYLQKKKNWLECFKKKESNMNVINWVNEYVDIINKEIEYAKEKEERLDF